MGPVLGRNHYPACTADLFTFARETLPGVWVWVEAHRLAQDSWHRSSALRRRYGRAGFEVESRTSLRGDGRGDGRGVYAVWVRWVGKE